MKPTTFSGSTGSSPRMRGTPHVSRHADVHVTIIPAHAGNTVRVQPTELRARDHPRACGEHSAEQADKATENGSSPRMRGTPLAGTEPDERAGIIPAHAGNTEHA